MKNILISVISILLTVIIIICMFRGISIGQFKILSIPEIKLSSMKLDSEIEELNNLKNATYKKKLNDLQSSIKNLTSAKQSYLDLASISTDTEIQQANQEQTYAMEFLWNKVGTYATNQGLALTWNVVSTGVNNKYTLNFTITGSYIGIINYIYSLENDSELAFRIENFKIVSAGAASSNSNSNSNSSTQDNTKVTATFTVSNIGIKEETVTSLTTSSSNTNNTNKNENKEKTQDNTTDNANQESNS